MKGKKKGRIDKHPKKNQKYNNWGRPEVSSEDQKDAPGVRPIIGLCLSVVVVVCSGGCYCRCCCYCRWRIAVIAATKTLITHLYTYVSTLKLCLYVSGCLCSHWASCCLLRSLCSLSKRRFKITTNLRSWSCFPRKKKSQSNICRCCPIIDQNKKTDIFFLFYLSQQKNYWR